MPPKAPKPTAPAPTQVSTPTPAIMLPPLLDMKQAAPLADALLAARGGPVVVAAAAVERLGAQCLQVLLSARASWESDGHSFMLQNPSAPLRDALSLAGVAPSVFNCVQEPDA